jgi:hypothetical protein
MEEQYLPFALRAAVENGSLLPNSFSSALKEVNVSTSRCIGLFETIIASLASSVVLSQVENCGEGQEPQGCSSPPLTFDFTPMEILNNVLPPGFMTVANLDADGRVDLVWTNLGLESISVSLSTAEGFKEPVTYQTGHNPGAVAVADFDGDESLDIAVPASGLSVLLNDGMGKFTAAADYEAGVEPGVARAADIDGDGDMDLGVATQGSPGLIFLGNRGNGTFEFVKYLFFARGLRFFTLADLDNDGLPDLANTDFIVEGEFVLLWQNIGGFNFARLRKIALGGVPWEVRDGDLDGDDDLDLVVSNNTAYASILLNRGDATFENPVNYDLAGPGGPITVADLEGDGDLDLIRVSDAGVAVLENGGDGTFAPQVTVNIRWSPTGDHTIDLVTGDFLTNKLTLLRGETKRNSPDCNGNGIPDECELAASDCNGNCIPDDCDVAAKLAFAPPAAHGDRERTFLAALDADQDGDQDLVVSGLSVLFNRGDGTFEGEITNLSERDPRSATFGDLDGDGSVDIAYANDRGITVAFNNGKGSFGETAFLLADNSVSSVAAADIDADGDLDLAAVNHSSETLGLHLSMHVNGGQRAFTRGKDVPLASDGDTKSVMIAADLSGDGAPDFAVAPRGTTVVAGRVFVALNPGPGKTWKAVKYDTGNLPTTIFAADLDGDQDLDLITESAPLEALYFLLNRGDGSFDRAVPNPVPFHPTAAAACDLDGDGFLELAVCRTEGFEHVSVLRRKDDGSFQGAVGVPARYETSYVTCVDLDGDGKSDLIANTSGEFYSILNRTTPAVSRDVNRNRVPDECEPRPRFHRGDANGDGVVDISDGLCVLAFLFDSGGDLSCREAGDANNDGKLDCSDSILILGYLFVGTRAPITPGPPPSPCGPDPDAPGSPEDLGCESYTNCVSPN